MIGVAANLARRLRIWRLLPSPSDRPQGLDHEQVWTEGFVAKLGRDIDKRRPRPVHRDVAPLGDRTNRYLLDCKTVLDVGCGWMPYQPDSRYTGLDVSVAMIRRARDLHPGIRFFQHDAYNLPFGDGEFEGVRSSGMLRHMRDWRTPLQEMVRVCSKRLAFSHLIGGREERCGRYQWCTMLGEVLKLLPSEPTIWVIRAWPGFESVLFMLERDEI